jgi:hypothetical protein
VPERSAQNSKGYRCVDGSAVQCSRCERVRLPIPFARQPVHAPVAYPVQQIDCLGVQRLEPLVLELRSIVDLIDPDLIVHVGSNVLDGTLEGEAPGRWTAGGGVPMEEIAGLTQWRGCGPS